MPWCFCDACEVPHKEKTNTFSNAHTHTPSPVGELWRCPDAFVMLERCLVQGVRVVGGCGGWHLCDSNMKHMHSLPIVAVRFLEQLELVCSNVP